jgi:hypothetical protein
MTAGDGSFTLDTSIPQDTSLVGQDFYVQTGYLDPIAPRGVSLSAALRLEIY